MNIQEAEERIKELQSFIEREQSPKEVWMMVKGRTYMSPKDTKEECQQWIDELHADNPKDEFDLYRAVLFREVRDEK